MEASSRVNNAVTLEEPPAPVQLPIETDPLPTGLPADLEANAAATPNTTVQEIPPPSTAPLPLDPPSAELEPQQNSPDTLAEAQPAGITESETPPAPEATESGSTTTDTVTTEVQPTEPQPTESQEAEVPVDETTHTEAPGLEPTETQAPEQTQETSAEPEPAENAEDNAEENAEEAAYYAEDEDTSVPDEAEMKEIESQAEGDYSAHECKIRPLFLSQPSNLLR